MKFYTVSTIVTRVWVIISAVSFGLAIILTIAVGYLLPDCCPPKPLISPSRQKQFSSDYISFAYPGNWHVDAADQDEDALDFTVICDENGFAKFGVGLYEGDWSLDDGVAYSKDHWTNKLFEPANGPAFSQWGAYAGSGCTVTGRLIKRRSVAEVFHTEVATNLFLVVTELCEEEYVDRMQPGFQLICDTLKVNIKIE